MNGLPCDPALLARALFDVSPDALILFDVASEQIVDVNPVAQQLIGAALSDLLRQPIRGLFRAEVPDDELYLQYPCRAREGFLLHDRGKNAWIPVALTLTHLATQTPPLGLLQARDLRAERDARRESRQRFDIFMNAIPMLGFMKDADGRMIYVNQEFARRFERPADHFLGKLNEELWPGEVARHLREIDLAVMAGAGPVEGREFVPTPDGVLREWWVVKFPLSDSGGRVFLGGIALDLTERRQFEEALHRSESRYQELWQRSLAGIVRASLDGRILDCNESFARLFGFESREQMFSHSTKELYFDVGVREEFITRLRAKQVLTNYEMQMRRADGSAIWVLETVRLLVEDGQEILEGTLVDISDRKRIEEALRTSVANYRTLINHLDQAIFLKDRDLRYVMVNPIFCAGVGMTEEQLRGKTIGELFPDSAVTQHGRELEMLVLATGRSIESEEEIKHGNTTRAMRVSRAPVKDSSGAIVGVLGICWDVTAQRGLEAQLRHVQKMDAIGQLAGGIAHDFNNLLTIMLGNLSFVLSHDTDRLVNLELLKNAEKAGLRAAELTQTLLGFSRRAALATVPFNLNQAIEEVIQLTRSTMPDTIELEMVAQPQLWLVQADPVHLNQVLMNLTLNARDALPDGGKIVFETSHFVPDAEYLSGHVEASAGEFVRLRVRDTGLGIPAELRQRIFEPFFTTKEKGKGTGLGLAIVFSIVKQHNGWIVCDSAPGRGTSFDVFLPRCPEGPAANRSDPAQEGSAEREMILLVDDEPMIRQLTRTILAKAGFQVLVAENGADAIELVRAHPGQIALIILDAVMPRLSGRDTLRELAGIAPGVRVLFSSGYSTEQMGVHEFPQVRGFLPKPYRAEQLIEKVSEILGGSR
jgi:PAS domain S-box-containing protein